MPTPLTIPETLRTSAAKYPEKPAIIYKDQVILYRELFNRVLNSAAQLKEEGISQGDRVGIISPKTPEALIAMTAIMAAGGTAFTIDYNLTSSDIKYVISLTNPAKLFCSDSCRERLDQVDGILDKDLLHLSPDIGRRSRKEKVSLSDIKVDSPAYLNFTSGTTGTPKAAVTTHANIFWNSVSSVEALQITEKDVHLCMFPIYGHPHEIIARPFLLGGTIVIPESISPSHIARAVFQHKTTCMMAVASIYLALARYASSRKINLSSLNLAESGGMYVNTTLAEEFRKLTGVSIVPVWGSTETAGVALANSRSDIKPCSIGRPCPYYDVQIVADDGTPAATDETGEMLISGPAVCSSYLDNREETGKHLYDNTFFTGDYVREDKEGYFFFSGRRNRMMKVAGLKVSPVEIEETISLHPKVAEVAVVSTNHRSHGETARAVIVSRNRGTINEKDIRKHCELLLAKHKIPRVIEFTDKLPRSSGGKILYQDL